MFKIGSNMLKYNRGFGVEFEFACEWADLKKHASKIIKEVYGKNKYLSRKDRFDSDEQTDKWHIKEENHNISEICTPISKFNEIPKILQVINYLKSKGIKPTHSDTYDENCGIHIHVDVTDMCDNHLLAAWMMNEQAIINCFPKCRRASYILERTITKKMHRKRIANVISDYFNVEDDDQSNVNLAHDRVIDFTEYENRGTIEFRLAEGSNNAAFIGAWIKFILAYVDYVKKLKPTYIATMKTNSNTLEGLLYSMTIDNKSADIIRERNNSYKNIPYWN